MRNLKKLLYLCNYPPGDLAGACVIMKQVFSRYDTERLTVVCDKEWLSSAREKCPQSLIPCRHESVACRFPWDLRPRRIWARLRQVLNFQRVDELCAAGERIAAESGLEAVFAPLHDPEFAIAAHRLHRRLGIPLYLWESDDWPAMYAKTPILSAETKRQHAALLRDATTLWMTSYSMINHYKQKFGVDGKFLFNYADLERFAAENTPDGCDASHWNLVYTGAINGMFDKTLRVISSWINEGIDIAGKTVKLKIYTNCDCGEYVGPQVSYEGFVSHDKIPGVLVAADALLVAVTFAGSEEIQRMVKTSLYTKTIEYLASRRPVVYVGPRETAEFDYFGEVMECVHELKKERFIEALRRLLSELPHRKSIVDAGYAFVQRRHSVQAIDDEILSVFERG